MVFIENVSIFMGDNCTECAAHWDHSVYQRPIRRLDFTFCLSIARQGILRKILVVRGGGGGGGVGDDGEFVAGKFTTDSILSLAKLTLLTVQIQIYFLNPSKVPVAKDFLHQDQFTAFSGVICTDYHSEKLQLNVYPYPASKF